MPQYQSLRKYFEYFQIDIADGVFVPNTTITLHDIKGLINSDPSLFQGVTFDFHLMVKDYKKYIDEVLSIKDLIHIKNIFVHFGALHNDPLLSLPDNISLGLVLNPEDSVEVVTKIYQLNDFSAIQIMTVTPGFQGNSFKPEQLRKIKELRERGYTGTVFIDGSVNERTIPEILAQEYLPDYAGVGSYLTKAPATEIPQRVEILNHLLQTK